MYLYFRCSVLFPAPFSKLHVYFFTGRSSPIIVVLFPKHLVCCFLIFVHAVGQMNTNWIRILQNTKRIIVSYGLGGCTTQLIENVAERAGDAGLGPRDVGEKSVSYRDHQWTDKLDERRNNGLRWSYHNTSKALEIERCLQPLRDPR